MSGKSTTTPASVIGINCPACGHPFTPAETGEVRAALGSAVPPPAPEPKSMMEAMDAELDDPERQKERATRKE